MTKLPLLKSCPFCGGAARLEDHRLLWCVRCSNCEATIVGERAEEPEHRLPESYYEKFKQSAVSKWNERNDEEK